MSINEGNNAPTEQGVSVFAGFLPAQRRYFSGCWRNGGPFRTTSLSTSVWGNAQKLISFPPFFQIPAF
jgi:hypothetical protein